MGELVCLEVTCLRESFVTLVAIKQLLSCMGEGVCFKVTCPRKCFVTLVALNGREFASLFIFFEVGKALLPWV